MSRRRSHSNRNKFHLKLKKSTIYSIGAVLLLLLAASIWISFSRQGILLNKINLFLVSNIGLVPTLFLPIPIIVSALMVTKIKVSFIQPHVFIGSGIILSALVGLFHDGDIGRQVWESIAVFISSPGAFVFLTAGIGIGLLVMLNIPFEDVVGVVSKSLKRSTPLTAKNSKGQLPLDRPIKMGSVPGPKLASKPIEVKTSLPTFSKPLDPKTSFTVQPPLPSAAADLPWQYPSLGLLSENIPGKADRGNVNVNAKTIEDTLDAFGVIAKVREINPGPAVTQYALEVASGTKLAKINALGSDLALALAAPTGQIRIEAPIPGRSLVGIELPNRSPEYVSLRKILESENMKHHKSKLAVAMGLDVSGQPVIADISKMPHVLIAGSTGSGKSVCINAFIGSLLFRTSPQELNLIMVDPKRVELTGYNGIPHLLSPVIVEPEKVLSALKWAMGEMDRRYKLFAEVGVRNLEGYNELSGFQALPYIVIFVDELADIMLFAPVEVEDAITRIAQMARATGIHLVIATQRPSVDIITGLIKANIPTRIAFAVTSMIDSRVIIDQPGAEKLLGKGDMLYVPPDQAKPSRIQGAFVSDKEIRNLVDFIKKQGIAPHYTDEVTNMPVSIKRSGKGMISGSDSSEEKDPLFEEALRTILQNQNASASFLQRKLSIGYARAARILDELQQAGIVGPADGAKPRDILITDINSYFSNSSAGSAQDSE